MITSSTDLHDVDIEFLDAAGDGVGRIGQRRVSVPFTMPGERIRVRLAADRRGDAAAVATIERILRPSPQRVTPRCRHFGPGAEPGVGACGGCAWQHIDYASQLRLKQEVVARLVRATVPQAPAVLPTIAASRDEPWGFRQKVHFVFGAGPAVRADGTRQPDLVMGHYARGSRRIVPVSECPVHDERGNAAAFRFRDEYVRARAAAVPEGSLKSLALRVGCASPELMGTLVVAREDDKRVRDATRRVLQAQGAPSSFHVNIHPKPDAYVFGRETRRVSGAGRLREQVAGVSFLVSPTAFFQTNVRAAEILVRLALAAIPDGARVLDLYAGAGLFTLPLARRGHEIVAVEESRAAVADGEASRRLNRIPAGRCRFVAQRAEQALQALARRSGRRSLFDAAVLDPPREGCTPAVIDALFGALAPPTVVYVSCNPEALARDLAAIARFGYRVGSLQPIDMFPHTAHVETVAILQRQSR